MSSTRQTVAAAAVVLLALAGGVGVTVYLLRTPPVALENYESNPVFRGPPATKPDGPTDETPLRESLPAVATPESTIEQRRARLTAFWNQPDPNGFTIPPPTAVLSGEAGATQPADADVAAVVPTRRVSLHLKDASPREAMAAVGKLAGVRPLIYPPYALRQTQFPTVTLDADDVPLVELASRVEGALGLRPARWNETAFQSEYVAPLSETPDRPIVFLTPRQPGEGPGLRVTSGPVAASLMGLNHVASLSSGAVGGTLSGSVAVRYEPGLTVIAESVSLRLTEAVDESGRSLLAKAAPGQVETVWQSVGDRTTFNFSVPADVGRTLARLGGVVRFVVATKQDDVEVAADAASVSKVAGGVKLDVRRDAGNGMLTWQFVMNREKASVQDWRQLAPSIRTLRPVLYDTAGRAFPPPRRVTYSTGSDQQQSITLSWGDNAGNASGRTPGRLVVRVPTETKVVDVPVSWTNLPLP